MKNANYMGMVAAALLGLSSFLPWIRVSVLGFSTTTTGIESNDGWLVLSMAIVAGLLHFVVPKFAFIPGLIALAIGLYDIYDLVNAGSERELLTNKGVDISLGIGMYLLLLSALGVVLLSLSQWRTTRRTEHPIT